MAVLPLKDMEIIITGEKNSLYIETEPWTLIQYKDDILPV